MEPRPAAEGRRVRDRRDDALRPVGELSASAASPAGIVLVDGENVRRSRWPNVSREELVERCRAWAARQDARVVVVFDGGEPTERTVDDRCTVAGTGAETADDWIARRAAELVDAARPYTLVTSDRALRDAAGARAERTIGGGSFLGELGR